jgi:hypothetical protein
MDINKTFEIAAEKQDRPPEHHIWCNIQRGNPKDCSQCIRFFAKYPPVENDPDGIKLGAKYFPDALPLPAAMVPVSVVSDVVKARKLIKGVMDDAMYKYSSCDARLHEAVNLLNVSLNSNRELAKEIIDFLKPKFVREPIFTVGEDLLIDMVADKIGNFKK